MAAPILVTICAERFAKFVVSYSKAKPWVVRQNCLSRTYMTAKRQNLQGNDYIYGSEELHRRSFYKIDEATIMPQRMDKIYYKPTNYANKKYQRTWLNYLNNEKISNFKRGWSKIRNVEPVNDVSTTTAISKTNDVAVAAGPQIRFVNADPPKKKGASVFAYFHAKSLLGDRKFAKPNIITMNTLTRAMPGQPIRLHTTCINNDPKNMTNLTYIAFKVIDPFDIEMQKKLKSKQTKLEKTDASTVRHGVVSANLNTTIADYYKKLDRLKFGRVSF